MRRAGFLFAGGGSRRMGRDKALLAFGHWTLAQELASRLEQAAGWAGIAGPPERYAAFGFPVIPDIYPECGPLGGLHAVLSRRIADWNLILACDMPLIPVSLLTELLDAAEGIGELQGCVAAAYQGRAEPLCAVYHSTCLPEVEAGLSASRLKMHDLLARLQVHTVPSKDPFPLLNVNTPEEWAEAQLRPN